MKKFRLLAVAAIMSLAAVGLTASTAISQTTDPNDPGRGLESPPDEGAPPTNDVGSDDRDNAGDGGVALDQVILDDLIVDGSACVGQDCVNGESFGFDTIRLKENNLRIRFTDTSTTASFPTRDWQLTANDTSNGGADKFSIDDIDRGSTPFTIEGNAPSHVLYVDSAARIGINTNSPVATIHAKSGNTPTLRLEQDGTSGFTPQTWDMASNEANFFIRDATNGSTLPFRIEPGAPSNALYIEASTGNIGLGTTSPDTALDIVTNDPTTSLRMAAVGGVAWQMLADNSTTVANNGLSFTLEGSGIRELRITPSGDLAVAGDCIQLDDDLGNPRGVRIIANVLTVGAAC